MTLSLSIDRILDSVYAHSAAEIVATGTERPELLGTSHAAMLRVIVRDTIASMSFAMAHAITGSNIGDNPIPDIITIDFNLPGRLVSNDFQSRRRDRRCCRYTRSGMERQRKPYVRPVYPGLRHECPDSLAHGRKGCHPRGDFPYGIDRAREMRNGCKCVTI